MASKTDAKNQTTTYTYDSVKQQLTREEAAGGPWRSYTYDTQGRVATVQGPADYGIWTVTYNYTAAGQVSMKKLSTRFGELAGWFGYDQWGRMNNVVYPSYWGSYRDPGTGELIQTDRPGGQYLTWNDMMNRPATMHAYRLQSDADMDMVWDVVYGPGDELREMKYYAGEFPQGDPPDIFYYRTTYHETRTYNTRLQLTRITATGAPDPSDPGYALTSRPPNVDLEYRYSATANDGRITQRKDWVTGEEVNYGYDSLGRLSSAVTTGPEWGLNFNYDGFGNLTNETAVKGSAPNGSFLDDQATNRLAGAGYGYDANGNMTAAPENLTMSYDAWNRTTAALVYSTGSRWTYGPGNERIIEYGYGWLGAYVYFYGPDGKLLGKYSGGDGSSHLELIESYVYFAGRLIWTDRGSAGGKGAVVDRVGSVISDGATRSSCFPYGESSSPGARFATYPTRDTRTGLDYAYNRYYSSRFMRFTSPDPYMASGGAADPQSWNRYAYVGGDPVNRNDPTGLWWEWVGSWYEYEMEADSERGRTWQRVDKYMWHDEVDGGGGGGEGGETSQDRLVPIENYTTTSSKAIAVQNSLRWLKQAIGLDDTCDKWLGTSAGTIDYLLGEAPGWNTMFAGVGDFPDDPNINAVAGVAGTTLPSGTSGLIVNSTGGFFNDDRGGGLGTNIVGGTDAAKAFVLLHELGHLTGAGGFLANDRSDEAQRANNAMVLENCGRTVSRAAGILP